MNPAHDLAVKQAEQEKLRRSFEQTLNTRVKKEREALLKGINTWLNHSGYELQGIKLDPEKGILVSVRRKEPPG